MSYLSAIRRSARAFLLAWALLAGSATAPAAAQTVYVAFGDSITEGVGDAASRAEKGYPPRLEELFQQAGESVTVLNRGIGGELTAEGVSRIDSALSGGGDVVLLMEGTNDVGAGISIETTRFNLAEMARKAEARGFSVVFGTIVPRIPTARQDPQNRTTERLAQEIRDLAGSSRRDLADPYEVFSTAPNVFRDLYDDTDPGDRVGHPNAEGYDLLARTFFDVLRGNDTVPPVVGLMTPPNGAVRVGAGATITVDIWDFGEGLDIGATRLTINGTEIPAVESGNSLMTRLSYTPPSPLSGVIELGLESQDFASPANRVDRVISTFSIRGTQFLRGDLDQDGRVDGADLVAFGRAFGSTRGQARYLLLADFNDDRRIDGDDLAVLAANFGESSL